MGKTDTPLMRQYSSIKAKYPDAILLFRVGDFYETFGEDAIRASAVLNITLTKRKNGAAADMELAGFPHHALDVYLPKLVRAGHRVAICDQLEDPKLTKTIVKRGVTEVVTPGLTFNESLLSGRTNNYLASLSFSATLTGVAFLDISTGEFLCAQGSEEYVEKLISSFRPGEIVYPKLFKDKAEKNGGPGPAYQRMEDWAFHPDFGREKLNSAFGTMTLKGFGIDQLELGIAAAGAALQYLEDTLNGRIDHITKINRIDSDAFVRLDRFTIKNLELLDSPGDRGTALVDILDRTYTPMGGRMMRKWVIMPLRERPEIEHRLDQVDLLAGDLDLSGAVNRILKRIGDTERLISKVATNRVKPPELRQLSSALVAINELKELFASLGHQAARQISNGLNACKELQEKIERLLADSPAMAAGRGDIIRPGMNAELDALRGLAFEGKDKLAEIQSREITRTGISSLKVAFNSVFGYYLEVRNTHKDKVPDDWIRRQTLTQAERYITPELKEYEEKILGAEGRIMELEQALFDDLVRFAAGFVTAVQSDAALISELDCLASFAQISAERGYCRPFFYESNDLKIIGGRHPVIELKMPAGEVYIDNDITLNEHDVQICMITGPNMSGKSALLRQTALIILMAQMGCFVPARSAELGVVDKVFTRVGASDNLSNGESTFMVEMTETAEILNNLSERSLILLDEIGRGTSTYDGISIAWSIAQYIHEHPLCKAKTLFATHYHELNEMAAVFPRIRNFNVSVKEHNGKIIFLRKLKPGGSNHSFGLQVARLAGVPDAVVKRAEEVLSNLERSPRKRDLTTDLKEMAAAGALQLSFFQLDDPLLAQISDELRSIDIDTLTPVEALLKLSEIKRMACSAKKSVQKA